LGGTISKPNTDTFAIFHPVNIRRIMTITPRIASTIELVKGIGLILALLFLYVL